MRAVGIACFVLLLVICLTGIHCEGKACDIHVPFQCPTNETCVQTDPESRNGQCRCILGYRLEETGNCVPVPPPPPGKNSSDVDPTVEPVPSTEVDSGSSASTITAGVLVPLSVFVVSGLMYVAHRYKWLDRLNHLRIRSYDEVVIGQDDDDDDDPPLRC